MTEFEKTLMRIQLNFSDPIFVSTYGQMDALSFRVLNPNIFKAETDNHTIEANYTLYDIAVGQQFTSTDEKENVEAVSSAAESSMVVSLIIPFCFMVFMSVSMNRVWSLYNNL